MIKAVFSSIAFKLTESSDMLKNHIHLSIDYGYKVALAHWSRMSCVHGSLTSKYNASATKLTEVMNDEENRQSQVLSKNEIVYFCNWVSFLIFSWHRSILTQSFVSIHDALCARFQKISY